MDIKGKVIIVTGASMGIGEATARALATRGARVVVAARSADKLEKLAQALPDGLAVVTDMTDPASIKHLVQATMERYGRIDVLVNNARQGIYGEVENVDVSAYQKVITLNVLGPLRAMQEVIPIMRQQGGGMIVNISSMVSKAYYPYLGAYASTKYALNALALTARAELEKDNIIVSVVHPGMTATEFGAHVVKSDVVATGMQSRRREGLPEPDSVAYVAGKIAEAIERGQAEVYAHNEQAEANQGQT